jgi:Protein of unknown function (DUF1592)/Protein of unknown function (DUF1588)/Protein of unknown function (DUF1587)/Protein of unknown function (DUF1585)/Protein of unknown function (DUF1595)/Planctomycete cytochrome C
MHSAIKSFIVLIAAVTVPALANADPASDPLDRGFRETVVPFLKTYCYECHGKAKPKARLDLSAYTTIEAVCRDQRRWENVLTQLQAETMPPDEAKHRPAAAERREVVDWIIAVRRQEAKRNAGDPGVVPARRLSNAEYDYTIRDLTGVDIRPTREFPVDPANEAGFDNSAESLTMSPALLKKYLQAARQVTEHLLLKPEGFVFAPHPVLADTDRDKYGVRRIIEFYQRQPIDFADYFQAAWRFQHRAALGRPKATLVEVAVQSKVSPKYLATIWSTLTEAPDSVGPIAALKALWRELPAPDASARDGAPDSARPGCERMRDFVVRIRRQLVPEVKNLSAPGISNGSQCLVLWKNRQFVANRMRYVSGALTLKDTGLTSDTPAARALSVPADKDAAAEFETTFQRFCSTFPDAFFISERGRVFLDEKTEKRDSAGRLLSAGFHSMTGYFRDDAPLYELILDRDGQRELDRLWREFDFITGAPIRQHTSFIWYERAETSFLRDLEFDSFRSEDKDCTSEAKIDQLAELYLAKARKKGASAVALEAIEAHFKNSSAAIRAVEEARLAAEPSHLAAAQAFAERAYRRPLSKTERDDVAAFYRSLRDKDGLGHEEAVRDTIVSILMSPHFCFRVDLLAAGNNVRPLTDLELASRLSYFLWSSMPDEELLARAAEGALHRPEVLLAQTRRMLRHDSARALAAEFGGNWLDFRRFEEHNSVDRGRFPSFNDELRQAMFEEPIRFFIDVARADRSVLDFLYAKHTFVNPVLARHYGMPDVKTRPDEWRRIDDADRFGRGGMLPMAVFLTKNAPGLRTSPVKRGYWVVRRLLGEVIPPPPPNVPDLPSDEAKLGELTLAQTLAHHRENSSCAVCHNRFDSIGLVFEGFGPIGERRANDLGGRPVETKATFPDGSNGSGLDGLRTYLREHRQKDFVDNLCRKLLSYGLGRTLQLSDDPTVDEMRVKLAANGYRFSTLVESIATSPQFLNKRGHSDLPTEKSQR